MENEGKGTASVSIADAMDVIRELLQDNREMRQTIREMSTLVVGTPRVNGRGGHKESKPVRDTKTGIVYRTESSAGKAVASEYGLAIDNFVWYKVIKADPTRFEHVSPEVYEDYAKKMAASTTSPKPASTPAPTTPVTAPVAQKPADKTPVTAGKK